MRIACLAVLALAVVVLPARATEALYAATSRAALVTDPARGAGSLYRVDPGKGSIELIGPLRIEGVPIGVTGLADDPATGVLYGITAEASPNYPHSLVTIDIGTAAAKFVGDIGAPATDIAFGPHGNLYTWLRLTRQLAIVDTSDGAAQPIGPAGPPTETAALTIDANDRAYLTIAGATGTLDTIDTNSGLITPGPRIAGAPFQGINSLTVTPGGRLFAVNTNLGRPASTMLIAIDPASGAVSQIVPLPNDADALVFVEPPWRLADLAASRGALTAAAAVVVVIAVAAFLFGTTRRG